MASFELTGLDGEGCARRSPAALDGAKGGTRLRQEHASGRRQRGALRQPVDDGAAQLGLECADVLRERRLRDPDPLGRPGERALLGHGDEALELTEVHPTRKVVIGRTYRIDRVYPP